MSLTTPVSLQARLSRACGAFALLLPLLLYVPWIETEAPNSASAATLHALTQADLLAPPGAAIYWLLMLIPAQITAPMMADSHFPVALLGSALPVALTCWVLYRAARHLDVHPATALFAALFWASGPDTLVLATRAHPYGLDALWLITLLYAALRFIKDPGELRWLALFASIASIASAHRLSYLAAWSALAIMIALTERRLLWRPRIALGLLAAGLMTPLLLTALWLASALDPAHPIGSSSALIAYLVADPLLVDPNPVRMVSNAVHLWTQWFLQMFPGAPLLAALGLWHVTAISWPRRWLLVAVALLSAPLSLLLLSRHPAFSELAAAWLAALTLFTALGLQRLSELEFWHKAERQRRLIAGAALALALLTVTAYQIYRLVASFSG